MSADDPPLRLYRNPFRLLVSAGLWRAAWYLAGYVFAVGWVLFAAGLTATVTAAAFAITLAGLPLLIAAAEVLRWCADVERARLRPVLTVAVGGGYRDVSGTGLIARARERWRDPATWRDAAYLIGLWGPLFILDTAVLAIWVTLLGLATLPVWYWAPRGNAGVGRYVDTLPRALLAAAIFAMAFLLFNYVVVLTARVHAAVAQSLLHAPIDPLAEAKEVLAVPGPLGPLQDTISSGSPVGHST
jgi:Putative sensor